MAKQLKIPRTQEDLLRIIAEQNQQLQTLKQAVLRLEKKLYEVSSVAKRSQEQTRRLNEEVRGITHVLTRNR